MLTLEKETLIFSLTLQKTQEKNTTKKRQLENLINFIQKLDIQVYNNLIVNRGGCFLNIGFICEYIILKYLGLEKENDLNEIKAFIINTPHIVAKNSSRKVVYIFSTNEGIEGLYKVSADLVKEKRINKKDFKNFERVATLKNILEKING